MVNDAACQKQEASNKKCKPEVSKTNLLFFTKVPAVGLPLKWFTPRPYVHKDLHHTVWNNGWIFIYEISGYDFKFCFCHLYLRWSVCFGLGVPSPSANFLSEVSLNTGMLHEK